MEQVYAVRVATESRATPSYDGFTPVVVNNVRVVDTFVERSDSVTFKMIGVLLKVKCANKNSLYLVADYEEGAWMVNYPEDLVLEDDDRYILQDYCKYALEEVFKQPILHGIEE